MRVQARKPAFLKFHNAVVALLSRPSLSDEALFKEARRQVMWHYQWMVLHDFVERITGALRCPQPRQANFA